MILPTIARTRRTKKNYVVALSVWAWCFFVFFGDRGWQGENGCDARNWFERIAYLQGPENELRKLHIGLMKYRDVVEVMFDVAMRLWWLWRSGNGRGRAADEEGNELRIRRIK